MKKAGSSFVPRKRQDRGERRVADIVSAASSLFGAHGFDGTTMNAIAQRAGLSIGSLYQYFPDKDAIVHAVAASYIRAWESKTEALMLTVADMDLTQLARRSVEGTVDFDRQHAAIRAFLDADPRRAPSILEVQTRVDPGIPLLARFYPRADHRALARVIEIVSLIVRNVAPRIAEETEVAKRELFISEISLAVLAYVTSALGPPNGAKTLAQKEEQSMPNGNARRKTATD
jgi:AcrR family transcriptional regulator